MDPTADANPDADVDPTADANPDADANPTADSDPDADTLSRAGLPGLRGGKLRATAQCPES
ncbi:MAG: hypothetical protein HGA45_13295 [Chloroflexales bacterium]|nr:hypothetical protein [Chloroflexales bacterium]